VIVVFALQRSGVLRSTLPARPEPGWNVLLISVDTLRADHLGLYGYDRPTSPNIDRLGSQGAVFEQVVCQNTNTNPSHASILSGLYPRTHGSWDNYFMMAPDVPMAPETFRQHGYRTAAFVSGYTLKQKICGLDRGFEVYDDEFGGKERTGDVTTTLALDWLQAHSTQPFFLFVHLFDPHGPYDPPAADLPSFEPREPEEIVPLERIPRYQRLPRNAPEAEVWTDLNRYKASYDAEIAFADLQVGRILDAVEELGLASSTVVLFTSDHGEALDERFHLLDHGGGLGDEEILVPFILRLPDGRHAGQRFPGQVQTIDIWPTAASAVGLTPSQTVQGRDLLQVLERRSGDPHPEAFTETRIIPMRWRHRAYELKVGDTLKSVRRPDAKLVFFPGVAENYTEVYDLAGDPLETENVAGERPELSGELMESLRRFLFLPARRNSVADPAEDKETREIFESLGYLD
jgi:arylsulfatase A-like enzyme